MDKDLLIKGNKIYSPDTCCFVPHYINSLFTECKITRGNYPIGVSYDIERHLYQAKISINSRSKNLGRFNSETEAHNIWLKAKREYARELAINAYMNNEIDERIMNAIIKYAYQLE